MRALRRAAVRVRRRLVGQGAERGSAVVEFVTLGVLLLVPVTYLVVVLGRLQAATFAAEGAARQAAHVIAGAPDAASGTQHAAHVVRLALDDQGFTDVDAVRATEVHCSGRTCQEADSTVAVTVTVDVVLPGMPRFVTAVVPTVVPVQAHAVATADRFVS